MRQLKHLKTLSLFVISEGIDHCQLDELKELDIGGSLKIKNLGRVSDASIAKGVSMAKMSNISKLELEWSNEVDDNRTKTRHEKICEALEVSTARLKILRMSGYKGVNLPKWVEKSYPSLTHLQLVGLVNVKTISSSNDNEKIVLFPLLEEFSISKMMNLRELVSPSCWSTGAFSNLCVLKISDCPKLGRLPPYLKTLKDVIVKGDCSDELLNSIWNLNGLTHLQLIGLNNHVENIFPVNMNGIDVVLFPFLEELHISDMENLRELVSPTIPSPGPFPNLSKIEISFCPNLQALPSHLKALKRVTVYDECSDELLYSISNLSALTHLYLDHMYERSVLFPAALMIDDVDEISSSTLTDNKKHNFQSLECLYIIGCPKLRRLFDEGMIMQETLKISGSKNQHNHHLQGKTKGTRCLISSLTQLDIYECPELMISFEEFGNLNLNNSLKRLFIRRCSKLVSSEDADYFIALLHSLLTRLGRENINVDILLEKKDGKQSRA
ncbi:disease resistance protein RGA2-like [Impatiens glandulifera]|uniref:disease resistance protein RGA2-like n=1 Tax=Impatiens glandulifera TaxID=253017 RepID=UPI001FB04E94|nr:disease resistance protein RGA2-like [Impatiens glandulifera]